MDDLNTTQLRQALNAARELAELRELEEFPPRATQLLRGLVTCEHASYNAIDLQSGRAIVVTDPADCVFDGGPEVFACYAGQNPLVVRARAGDTDALRLSDHLTRRQLHHTDLYHHVYRVIELEYQLAAQLPSVRRDVGRGEEVVGFSLSRARRDFSAAEQLLITTLAPLFTATLERLHELAILRAIVSDGNEHAGRCMVLINAQQIVAWASPAAQSALDITAGEMLPAGLQRWVADQRDPRQRAGGRSLLTLHGQRVRARLVLDAYPGLDGLHLTPVRSAPGPGQLRSLGLTRRQADVLALALQGHTSPQIAQELTLSPRTVENHLDAIYKRLGVRNRSQAILTALHGLAPNEPR